MILLLSVFTVVFLLTFLTAPTMGAGWFWDAGNGLGFAAFAGLIYLGITSFRRLDVRAHQLLGYVVLLVAVAHALWFLLGDAAVVEFVKVGAPDYMWLGIVGLLLLFVLVTIALIPDRLRIHTDYKTFRYWHRILAVATIATTSYHIVVSNFYLFTWYQIALFVFVAIASSFGRAYWIKLGQLVIASPWSYLTVSVLFAAMFSLIRNFPA